MLRQTPGVSRTTTSFTVHLLAKRKPILQPTSKVLNLSPSASSPKLSSTTDTDQDSTGLPSIGANPNQELELVVPCIILEPKEEEEEEEMAPNLTASFKERQRKHLSESLSTALPPAKKTCPEDPHEVPVSNASLAPMLPSNVTGSDHVGYEFFY